MGVHRFVPLPACYPDALNLSVHARFWVATCCCSWRSSQVGSRATTSMGGHRVNGPAPA